MVFRGEKKVFNTIVNGIRYARVLPREKVLLHIYPESRFQMFTDGSKYWLPPLLAGDLLGGYLYFNDPRLLVSFCLAAVVMLCSVFFAYYYMGQCGLAKLNEGQTRLYEILCRENQKKPLPEPNRLILAGEMALALRLGNRDFLELI